MRHIAMAFVLCFVLTGCGSKGPVKSTLSGTVTYKGKPVNDASLHLEPMGEGSALDIPVDHEGFFRSAGVMAGDYRVKVSGSAGSKPPPSVSRMTEEQKAKMADKLRQMEKPGTIPFPDKYKSIGTSDLTISVDKGTTSVKLELKD